MNKLSEYSEAVLDALGSNFMPETKDDYQLEINRAKAKGYKVVEIDFDKSIVTQRQAAARLAELGVSQDCLFFQTMCKFGRLPTGAGEELNTIGQIINNAKDQYWDDEYPNFSNEYLELSSIEGEGSYFYEKATDSVYDVDWGEMDDLVSGKMKPAWNNFKDFIEWYYS